MSEDAKKALAEALEVASLRHGVQGSGGAFHIHRESALAQKMVDTMLEELAASGYEVSERGDG